MALLNYEFNRCGVMGGTQTEKPALLLKTLNLYASFKGSGISLLPRKTEISCGLFSKYCTRTTTEVDNHGIMKTNNISDV